jgi:hypothetical protein
MLTNYYIRLSRSPKDLSSPCAGWDVPDLKAVGNGCLQRTCSNENSIISAGFSSRLPQSAGTKPDRRVRVLADGNRFSFH